jgi:hypothetical protein
MQAGREHPRVLPGRGHSARWCGKFCDDFSVWKLHYLRPILDARGGAYAPSDEFSAWLASRSLSIAKGVVRLRSPCGRDSGGQPPHAIESEGW